MSYLVLPGGLPDFDKAVISFWFRIPQSSFDDKLAAPGSRLQNIIPLVAFGAPITAWVAEAVIENVAVAANYPGTPEILMATGLNVTGEEPIDPSYIGVSIDHNLEVSFQMPGRAAIAHLGDVPSQISVYSTDPLYVPPAGYDPSPGTGWYSSGFELFHTDGLTDTSISNNIEPERFYIQPRAPDIAADQWHHLLLSIDLSTACTTHGPPQTHDPAGSEHATTAEGTDSFCHLWYALDDVDYRGSADYLGPNFVDGGDDPNAILTDNASRVATSFTGLIFNLWATPASCHYPPEKLPSGDQELGIPAPTAFLDSIVPVEMAELQIFTGITLDTGIEANRRAFIDADGKPVPPRDADGPPPAEKLLGQKPDILLTGSGNWIRGINLGPAKVPDPDSEDPDPPLVPDPDYYLTPTGKIVAYSPGPSLHGSQAP